MKLIFFELRIKKATNHLNSEIDEVAEEFHKTKSDKEKDDSLSL